MNYIFRRPVIFILSFLILSFIAGCDSQVEDDTDSPEPLSAEMFSFDTDLFNDLGAKSSASKFNFLGASIRVWPVSLILSASTIVPIAVTQSALQSTPTFEDGVWTWTRTTTVENQSFEFVLTGEPDGSDIDWVMSISSDGPYLGQTYSDFELFTGRTSSDGVTGSWKLYYLIAGLRVNVLDASFNRPEDGLKQLTFKIPEADKTHGGDTILYQVDNLSRGFRWTEARKGIIHDINWNSFTKEGSIQANNHLNGAKGCWDKHFDDVGCPS